MVTRCENRMQMATSLAFATGREHPLRSTTTLTTRSHSYGGPLRRANGLDGVDVMAFDEVSSG